VPSRILGKTGLLSSPEVTQIQNHVVTALNMLDDLIYD
jgi:HD-GYP domain-containing protein (c-di-GMP phosphodiesterase class II)